MIIHNIEQNSDEWYEVRKGKFTASNANTISVCGKGLDTLIIDTLAAIYALPEPKYSNQDMERGHELEAEAASMYELETGNEISKVGFCELNEHVGCSPDRFTGNDGLVEIKCPNNKTYMNLLLDYKIKKEYIAQMQMQMYVTGRNWCDHVNYNPNYKKPLLIKRITKDDEWIAKIESGLEYAIEELKKKQKILCENHGSFL